MSTRMSTSSSASGSTALPQWDTPQPRLKATPTALPYPILRRLSSTSHSRVAPRARMAAGGDGRPGGGGAKKGVWISYTLRQVSLQAYQPVYSPLQRHWLPFTEGERLCLK
jgi:hypothetical protein